MKKIFLFSAMLSILSVKAFAEVKDGFLFKPFLSIEYSAPEISGGGANTDFRTNIFEKQLTGFENIAVGMHFRIHQYFGLNANWQQTELTSGSLTHYGSLQKNARFGMDQYNFSVLAYSPLIEDIYELFVEGGVSDMTSKLTFTTSSSAYYQRKAHETMGFYGLGMQIMPFDESDDALRISVQKYTGKLALLDSHYTTIRLGYLKSF